MPSIDYFSSETVREGLKAKTVRGGVAVAAGQAVGSLVQLASIPILARLLTPDQFGVVDMAVVFTGFAQLFADAGLSSATIQSEKIDHRQASNLFWIASAVGGTLALITLAFAYPLGWLYGRSEVTAIAAALAATFVMSGLTVQHQALMRRVMRFDALAAIRVLALVSGQATAIAVAWTWQSYWALVAGQLAQAAVSLVATWIACDWRPGRLSRGVGTRSMVEFGASLSAARFVNYLSRGGDRLLIGTALGAGTLGFYGRAYKVLLYPIQTINTPLSSVMVPALSRLNEQPENYCRAYFSAVRVVTAIGMPIVAFVALDAARLIPLVLGEKWAPCVPIFWALVPAAFVGTLNSVFNWVYVSRGRGLDQLKWQVLASLSALTGFAIGLPWGAVGVAAGFSASRVLTLPIGIRLAYRGTPLSVGRLLTTVAPVMVGTAVSVVAALLARGSTELLNSPSLTSSLLLAATLLGVYAAIVYALGVRSLTLPRGGGAPSG